MKLIYTASQVREAEKPYIEAVDYDGYLMQRAADAVAAEAQELLHGTENAKILLLIGPGNNGADTIYAGAASAPRATALTQSSSTPAKRTSNSSPAKVRRHPRTRPRTHPRTPYRLRPDH